MENEVKSKITDLFCCFPVQSLEECWHDPSWNKLHEMMMCLAHEAENHGRVDILYIW